MADPWDPYEELEVSRSASPEVIQAAYRRLARKYHPDSGDSPDTERMARLNRAYETVRLRPSAATPRRPDLAVLAAEGDAAAEAGDWARAARVANEMLQIAPNNEQGLLLAAEAHLILGARTEARRWADRALRAYPLSIDTIFTSAMVAERTEDWIHARGLAAALLVENPKDPDARAIYRAATDALGGGQPTS
jgi:tetratricopeptide (TPR) repeat protein